jgi:hypothetical protein
MLSAIFANVCRSITQIRYTYRLWYGRL